MSYIIVKYFNELEIIFTSNQWINATKVCQDNKKKLDAFIRSKRFTDYCESTEKLRNVQITELKRVIKGKGKAQGTYLHPYLKFEFARWISSDFAVWMDMINENDNSEVITKLRNRLNNQDEFIKESMTERYKALAE